MKQLVLQLEGKFPGGSKPTIIKVEPKLGTFSIQDKSGKLWANGQFAFKCD